MRPLFAIAGVLTLVASACTSTTSGGSSGIADGVADDLVLVYDTDGGSEALASYRPDGTTVMAYADASEGAIWQPIWSPDGRRVAWARGGAAGDWDLVTIAVDGTGRTVHPLPGRPDYLTYDPTSSIVVALTPSTEGFGLVIVDVLGDAVEPYALVDLGRPYFSDFSPDGGRVIAHVADEVRVVDLDGEATPLAGAAIGHQTPSWHPTDEVVFFTRIEGASNEIVRHDLTSGVSESIAAFDGFVFFDLDPAGSTLAVASFGRTQGQGPEAVRGSPQRTLGQGLWIVEADGGEPVPIDDQPASAPMWDPTGSRFLVRTSIGGAGRWSTYERDGTSSGTEDFDIDETLMPAYLPFWDQYVRSQTLWSPDGSRFVHAGRPEDGTSGIWIHDATESGPSIRLADGDLAFWSPT